MDRKRDENDKVREEDPQESEEMLKRRISSHPLFGLLMETHMDCLKVCQGEIGEIAKEANQYDNLSPKKFAASSPDLHRFMEAYCFTLNKFKEAIGKTLQESTSFVDTMYVQLEDFEFRPVESTESNILEDH